LRTFLSFILATMAVAIAAIVAVPFVVSTGWIREQATDALRDSTGRELIISGDTSLSVFPRISLNVSNATLSNPPGRDGDFARMDELDLGLELLPLLGGRVEVSRLVVTRPVISLEIDAAGVPNWFFTPPDAAPPAGASQDGAGQPAPAPLSPAKSLPAIENIQVGEMRLIDGSVTFSDLRSLDEYELGAINATIGLTSLDEPLALDGSGIWRGENVGFRLRLTEPRALATGTPSTAVASVDSAHLRGGFSGSVAIRNALSAEGELELSSPSLKELARWLGAQPPHVDGLGAFALSAAMTAGKQEIALSSARVALDGANAEGGILVSLDGTRPLLQATLAVDRIDVNRYLKGGLAAEPAAAPAGGAIAALGGAADTDAWDAEPIRVDGLGKLDADLRLSARELLFHNLRAGQSALAVTLRDSILTVDLSELQLYEGRAVGKLTVNGAGEMPAIAASFTVDDVAARAILRDSTGIDWLQGRSLITGSLASRGITEHRLVEALNGEITVRFTDGAIRGFNIAQMMRGLKTGAVFDWSREEAQQTDFSELSANFTIAKGIAQTDDLQMLGPLVRLNGAGMANLPARKVDFRISPKMVASLEGQGGDTGLAGIEIPFAIAGPWDSPTITPDLAAVLSNPEQVINTIEEIGRSLDQLRSGAGRDLGNTADEAAARRQPREFLDLFIGGAGDASGDGQGGGAPQPPPISEDDFNQLLGR